MEKKKRKIVNFIIFSTAMALCVNKGIKLVEAKNKAYELIENHFNEDAMHTENVVAHRGFSSLEPDNSYESVLLALECDCIDMIEIDVRMTQDGILVLHHDSFVSFDDLPIRIENLNLEEVDTNKINKKYPSFNIENYLYDDTLFQLDRFFNKDFDDTYIITFSSFTKWYSFDKPIIIDVKCNGVNRHFEDELYNNLKDHEDMVYIQSYDYNFLKDMKERYPDFKYLQLVRFNSDISLMDDSFDGYTVRSGLLSKIKVNKDKKYFLYTINSSKKYLNILNNPNYNDNMYIITDNPDYICALGEGKRLRKIKDGKNDN